MDRDQAALGLPSAQRNANIPLAQRESILVIDAGGIAILRAGDAAAATYP